MCSPATEHFSGYVVVRRLWNDIIAASKDCESEDGGILLAVLPVYTRFRYGEAPIQGFPSGVLPYNGYSTSWLDPQSSLQSRYPMLMPPVQGGAINYFVLALGLSRLSSRRRSPLRRIMGRGCIALPIIVGLYDTPVRYLIGGFRAD